MVTESNPNWLKKPKAEGLFFFWFNGTELLYCIAGFSGLRCAASPLQIMV